MHNWRKDHDRLHNGQVSSVCLFVQYNPRRQALMRSLGSRIGLLAQACIGDIHDITQSISLQNVFV